MSHRRRGDDRWLEWKVRLFSVAAVLALAGIYTEERWMTGMAIVLLAGAVALRFLPDHSATEYDEGEVEEPDAGGPE